MVGVVWYWFVWSVVEFIGLLMMEQYVIYGLFFCFVVIGQDCQYQLLEIQVGGLCGYRYQVVVGYVWCGVDFKQLEMFFGVLYYVCLFLVLDVQGVVGVCGKFFQFVFFGFVEIVGYLVVGIVGQVFGVVVVEGVWCVQVDCWQYLFV